MNRRPISARESRWARATAAWLARAGVRPNFISLASVGFAAVAGIALVILPEQPEALRAGLFVSAAVCIQLRLLCNLFDGMVAIEGGFKTKSGEIFNELPDRFSDAFVLIGLGCAAGTVPFARELGWATAIIAVTTAYVRALGAATGAGQNFMGPMAKPQRMAVVTSACVLASVATFWAVDGVIICGALGIVVVGGAVTVWRRTRWIVTTLESK